MLLIFPVYCEAKKSLIYWMYIFNSFLQNKFHTNDSIEDTFFKKNVFTIITHYYVKNEFEI